MVGGKYCASLDEVGWALGSDGCCEERHLAFLSLLCFDLPFLSLSCLGGAGADRLLRNWDELLDYVGQVV